MVGLNDIDMPAFTSTGSFLNLTREINKLPYKADLSPGHVGLGTYQGKLYGVPYWADLSVLWYNKTLFKQAGLNPDDPPTTYAQILSDAQAINKLGHGISGFTFAGDCQGCLGFTVQPGIWADGTHLTNGDIGSQTANITGNTALVSALTLYRELWSQHLVPDNDRTDDGTTWGQDFAAGKIGIMPGGYGQLVNLVKPSQLGTEFMDTPLPGTDGGYSTFDGGDDFAIPAAAKNPSGAWEFIQWVLQTQQQDQYPALGATPVRTDVLTPAFTAAHPEDAVALKALAKGYAPVTMVYDQMFNQAGGPWFQMFTTAVYDGNMTPRPATGPVGPGQAPAAGLSVTKSAARTDLGGSLSARRARTGMLLVAPAFAMVAVFVLFPLGFAVYISLTNWPLIGPYHFVGGQNYSLLVHDPEFIHSVLFTLLYTAIVTGPIFIIGYAMAMLVRSNRVGATFFRTAFFLPFIIGLATESFMALLELQPDSGAADYVLGKVGLAHATTAWTVDYGLALTAICVIVDLVRLRPDDDAADGGHAGHPGRALRGGRRRRRDLVAEGDPDHHPAAAQEHRAGADHLGHRLVPGVQPVLHPDRGRPRHLHPARRDVDLRGGVRAVPPGIRHGRRDRPGHRDRDHQRRAALPAARRPREAAPAAVPRRRSGAPGGRPATSPRTRLARGTKQGTPETAGAAARGGASAGHTARAPGFALYLAGGTLASLLFLLPLAWAVARSFMPDSLVTQAPAAQRLRRT